MNDFRSNQNGRMNNCSIYFFGPMCRILLIAICIISFNYLLADDNEIKLTLNDKRIFKGDIKQIDDKGVVLASGESFKNDEVQEVFFRNKSESSNMPVLLLNNDSLLYFSEFQYLENKVSFGFLNETVELPLSIIKGLIYKNPSSENIKVWKKFLAQDVRKTDIVFVLKDEKLIPIEGIIKEIEKDKIKINWDGNDKTISIEKVMCLLFASPIEKFASNYEIQTIDGSKIYCSNVILKNDLCNIGLLQDEVNLNVSKLKICKVIFNNRKLIYLSSLEPLEISTEKILVEVGSYWEKDQSIWKKPLAIGNKTYSKGLGVHSYCKLRYKIPEGSLQFITEYGIDNEVFNRAGCVFKIMVDSKIYLDEAVNSFDGVKSIKIDLPNKSEEISIILEPGSNLDIGDHGVWGNARFIKN